MSCINSCTFVGLLTSDAVVKTLKDRSRLVELDIETRRPYKDRLTSSTKWRVQSHRIVCYKQAAIGMLEKHGKAGRWVKVLNGELDYDANGHAFIVVGTNTGDIGMMNSVGMDDVGREEGEGGDAPAEQAKASEAPQAAEPAEPVKTAPPKSPPTPLSGLRPTGGGLRNLARTVAAPTAKAQNADRSFGDDEDGGEPNWTPPVPGGGRRGNEPLDDDIPF